MQNTIGTVYGVLLNDRASIERLATEFVADPYKAPPKAPILYIKPVNTIRSDGDTVPLPSDPGRVQIGATIAAVIGQPATRVPRQKSLEHVAGYRVVADISLPHQSFFRPAIRECCRDGFCPMSGLRQPTGLDVSEAAITLSVNGIAIQTRTLAASVRRIDQLIADITEFMTLETGDILLLGIADQQPIAGPGDDIRIDVTGLGHLSFGLVLDPEEKLP